MNKGSSKKGLIVTIIVLGVTLLVVGGIVLFQNLNKEASSDNSTTSPANSGNDGTGANDAPSESGGDNTQADSDNTLPEPPTVDPSTLSSVDITPMSITVYYSKGVGGFDYQVKRADDRTEYVVFSSPDLVGTKCTGDEGDIASIIKDISPSENQTISYKKTIDGVTYGLSLAGSHCTNNEELLKEYQQAFVNGFGELKVMQ